MQIVMDISDKDYEKLKDGHIPFSILDVMQNGTPIPDNATNGDMPCITLEEMQKCKEVVKKYTPSVTQKSIECDDAISRAYIEPIIEELENICINGDEYILNLLADIKNAPLVTQKSGRWKVHKNYYECSNCESQISNEFFVNYRFCPHCGADMRGAE